MPRSRHSEVRCGSVSMIRSLALSARGRSPRDRYRLFKLLRMRARIWRLVEGSNMAGHTHPAHGQAGPLPHRQIEHGQRDRDAHPALQHLVEKAVARVVVLLAVAFDMQLLEQVGIGLLNHSLRLDLGPDPLFQLAAHPSDLIEIDRRGTGRGLFGPGY